MAAHGLFVRDRKRYADLLLQEDRRVDYPKSVPGIGLVNGKFVDENTASGTPGSLIPSTWGNSLTDELLNVIEAGGLVPSEGERDQLLEAIRRIIALSSTDMNTVRVTIATANKLDLKVAASNTPHINISGAGTISGFNVAAGKCYFVRFASAITLVNSVSVVTQSGSNLLVQAGDTCIIRAVSENVVEILMHAPFKNQAVGYGQNWQDLTASRVAQTGYINSTGKPIVVFVGTIYGLSQLLSIYVDNVLIASQDTTGSGNNTANLQVIVPPGSTYSASSAKAINRWMELR